MSKRPKVVLFDIGGVCVRSPFRAIQTYELAHSIPPGWINHAISTSGPSGAWALAEKGLAPLDAAWFAHFTADLRHEGRWREYWAVDAARQQGGRGGRGGGDGSVGDGGVGDAPPPPEIDAQFLFWEMQRVAQHPDPIMYPALLALRRYADHCAASDSASEETPFLIAALSNTTLASDLGEVAGAARRAPAPAPAPTLSEAQAADGEKTATATKTSLRALFDIFISSAHVQMRKPEREIYEHAVERLNDEARRRGWWGAGGSSSPTGMGELIAPEEILFLDDIGANLRTAKALGMRTIKVVLGRVGDAVAELESAMGVRLGGDEEDVDGDGGRREDGEGDGDGGSAHVGVMPTARTAKL